MNNKKKNIVRRIVDFYVEGFRSMTWGRSLWLLVLLKLVILFGVLRLFFFRPTMEGKSDTEKSDIVAERILKSINENKE